ncbi:MAG TPA: hypothetical protein VGQ00_00480 [Candidatus Norongarragalinales archaeon]|jgi:DNA-directed RNA polymerase subunit F|nr:hypothetical protein [Candidatus Norongarragalinales archaeon]
MKSVEEKFLTLTEVKELLEKRKKESDASLGYEQTNTLEYVETFAKLEPKDASALKKELEKAGIPEKAAVSVVNVLPKKDDEARSVLVGAGAEPSPEHVKNVVQLVKEYAKKA